MRLRAVIAEQGGVIQALRARVAELERQLGRHSRNSSRPPSSDGLGKPAVPKRERRTGGRKPGKQPGAPGAYLACVQDPDEIVIHAPERCQACGADLVLAPVVGWRPGRSSTCPRSACAPSSTGLSGAGAPAGR